MLTVKAEKLSKSVEKYIVALKKLSKEAAATKELSYHAPLYNLLKDICEAHEHTQVINEPRHTLLGRPDYVILKEGNIIGYIEA
jgi:hypothetical protein